MNKHILILIASVVAAAVSCKQAPTTPRPTIELVHSILADTTGLRNLPAQAGLKGAAGSIALVGDPTDVVVLARRFQGTDQMDNVDGRQKRDSLPDFAGECFDAIMDSYNAPYSHFIGESSSLDSLRETAVKGALFAWDSTYYRLATDRKAGRIKPQAKVIIYTSSLHARYGLFDVDTLQQLTGGTSRLISPVEILLKEAVEGGANNIAVWASRAVRASRVWEECFDPIRPAGATLTVITPDQAFDVRTQLRNLLRQFQVTGLPLDALIIDSYSIDRSPLEGELALIRLGATEEDAAFDRMLPASFRFYYPSEAIISTTYSILREENLFSHRIARPQVKYYESAESDSGDIVLVEAPTSHVQSAYVSQQH